MKAFQLVWWVSAATALVAGSFLAVVVVPVPTLVTLAVGLTMGIGLVARIVDEQHKVNRPIRRYLRIAAPGLVVGPAIGGLIGSLDWAGLLIVVLLIGSSPWVVRRFRKQRPVAPPPLAIEAKPVSSRLECPTEPADLADEQLFNAWQVSYVLLQHATTMQERITLVTARQRYLDELERRNPAGFRLWMANGARAASNPRRYLSSS